MAWHLAPSLAALRAEVNARWPRRDKASDGTVGDVVHAATASDHNPNHRGSVNAIDIDVNGVDVTTILRAAERHPSVHYWIFNREIADRDSGFRPQRYVGRNPHDKHLHISIRQTVAAEQDSRPWGLLPQEDDMPTVEEIWNAGFGKGEHRRTAGQLLSGSYAAATAALTAVQLLAGAVSGVDEATKAQLQGSLDALAAAVAAVPAQTVEALGDLDSPEEIAGQLRAVLGDRAQAVGELLAQG